jgi:hypothetical protein
MATARMAACRAFDGSPEASEEFSRNSSRQVCERTTQCFKRLRDSVETLKKTQKKMRAMPAAAARACGRDASDRA